MISHLSESFIIASCACVGVIRFPMCVLLRARVADLQSALVGRAAAAASARHEPPRTPTLTSVMSWIQHEQYLIDQITEAQVYSNFEWSRYRERTELVRAPAMAEAAARRRATAASAAVAAAARAPTAAHMVGDAAADAADDDADALADEHEPQGSSVATNAYRASLTEELKRLQDTLYSQTMNALQVRVRRRPPLAAVITPAHARLVVCMCVRVVYV